MKRIIIIFCLALLSSCGDSSTNSGSGSFGRTGATDFHGVWELRTIVRIGIAGGAATGGDFRTIVRIQPSGKVFVERTEIGCTFNASAEANFFFYEQKCVIENTSCIVDIDNQAEFSGDSLFGDFGPDSFVCEAGARVTGNITGRRIGDVNAEVPLDEPVAEDEPDEPVEGEPG